MRLINIDTLELEEFVNPPPYAILSHRWEEEEITYEAYCNPQKRQGRGYEKIVDFCAFLKTRRGEKSLSDPELESTEVGWAWVDTCCIDKRSSAELSEAINSMWNWYWNSRYCVAYLVDVLHLDDYMQYAAVIEESKWFKRGWTLQELLAPSKILVCNRDWENIGERLDLNSVLSAGSGVPIYYLRFRSEIFRVSVARRMSWASDRETTRKEDVAYCLFGLFEINLPLLYGEGDRAFLRLQQEIINQSNDESILAWSLPLDSDRNFPNRTMLTGILAPSPRHFWQSGNIHQLELVKRAHFTINKKHLIMDSNLLQVQHNIFLLNLNCVEIQHSKKTLGFRIEQARRLFFIPRTEKIAQSTHIEGQGCLIPLFKSPSGEWGRSHINSSTYEARYFSGVLSEWRFGYVAFTSRFLRHAIYHLAIKTPEVETYVSFEDAFLRVHEAEQNDVLWQRTDAGSYFDCFAKQRCVPEIVDEDSTASDQKHRSSRDQYLLKLRAD